MFVTVIEEANWLTLANDISHLIGEGFDAVICLGNSFAHMPDTFDDQREQRYQKNFVLFYITLSHSIGLNYLYLKTGIATFTNYASRNLILKIIEINRIHIHRDIL